MIGWIVYLVGFVISIRLMAGVVAYSFSDNDPMGEDWALGWLLGFLGAVIWPVMAVGYLLTKIPIGIGAERQARLSQKSENKLRELEATKAELRRREAELDLPHWDYGKVIN